MAKPGAPKAAEATQFVAAPLLAGAAIATIGVVGADGAQFRWPGPAMLALTVAAGALLVGIQLALFARHYLYSKAEQEEWQADRLRDYGWLDDTTDSNRWLQEWAMAHRVDFLTWQKLNASSRTAYESGLVMLLVGLMGLVAPPDRASTAHAVCRWCAMGVVAAVIVTQVLLGVVRRRWARQRERHMHV